MKDVWGGCHRLSRFTCCIALIARLLRLPRRRKIPPAGHKQVPMEGMLKVAGGFGKRVDARMGEKQERFEMKPKEKHHDRKSLSYLAGSFYNPLSMGMDKVCRLCLATT